MSTKAKKPAAPSKPTPKAPTPKEVASKILLTGAQPINGKKKKPKDRNPYRGKRFDALKEQITLVIDQAIKRVQKSGAYSIDQSSEIKTILAEMHAQLEEVRVATDGDAGRAAVVAMVDQVKNLRGYLNMGQSVGCFTFEEARIIINVYEALVSIPGEAPPPPTAAMATPPIGQPEPEEDAEEEAEESEDA